MSADPIQWTPAPLEETTPGLQDSAIIPAQDRLQELSEWKIAEKMAQRANVVMDKEVMKDQQERLIAENIMQ